MWKKWCLEKRIYAEEIENYEPAELNTLLERFYAEVKNKHGENYEPESLKVMIVSLDRHLKNKGYSLSIVRDREFSCSKQAKKLRLAGRGKRPKKARELSEEEEEILWKSGKLCAKTPGSLIHTMWWLLTQKFGLRQKAGTSRNETGGFQNHDGDDGLEFVEFAGGPTKTRPGGLNAKPRQFQLKMFQTGVERCPVMLFCQFISRRPSSLSHMRENNIDSMMKNIISEITLESSEKRFSNHSARKTLVSKMMKANLERSSIAKVTGHRNIQSLDDCDEADKDEQRQLSWAISERNSTAKPMPVASTTSGPSTSSAVIIIFHT